MGRVQCPICRGFFDSRHNQIDVDNIKFYGVCSDCEKDTYAEEDRIQREIEADREKELLDDTDK